MDVYVPYAGIILCVGPSNSGKTTLLQSWIQTQQVKSSEVVSSDDYRERVGDLRFLDWKNRPRDEASSLMEQYRIQSTEAFQTMDAIIESRCRLNKLTIVDATHLHPSDRERYRNIARSHHLPILTLVFHTKEATLLLRDSERDEPRGKKRVKQQLQTFKQQLRLLKKERYARSYSIYEDETVRLIRPVTSPIELDVGKGLDIVGDIHGCFDEFLILLHKLGYQQNTAGFYIHPEGRKILSLGDIMSRGPKSLQTLQFFYNHIQAGLAYMVDSNHGWKIARWLDGKQVQLTHGDDKVEQEFLAYEHAHGVEKAAKLKEQLKDLLLKAPSHYVLKKNGVATAVCVHAGIRDEWIGKQSHEISDIARYGETDGFDDAHKPIRKDWTVHHKTNPLIIWGHDPRKKAMTVNGTLNIDQGAVFGGELTAFRYPERDLLSVDVETDYSNGNHNPLHELEKARFAVPNIAKYIHGYTTSTELFGDIHIGEEHVIPAFDALSHVTLPLEDLVYIPPTMSPTPLPSSLEGYLEHPQEAIDYYQQKGITRMVAEKKHMGSRAVLLLFKTKEAALSYIDRPSLGVIYTRKGRAFFDKTTEQAILEQLNKDLQSYFEEHHTDFVLLDAEIMPWNLKAKELISKQYAHVAENARLDRMQLLSKLLSNSLDHDLSKWVSEFEKKLKHANIFEEVYQNYCWEVENLEGIQIAPFHVLAHRNRSFFDQPHTWHMEQNQLFSELSPLFVQTEWKLIDSDTSAAEVISWWEALTDDGQEGIIIKPESFICKQKGKLIQPAIKVRGQKYLHIIYGMDYLEPKNLERLKKRNSAKKQKLALREFSLGIEAVNRFVAGESVERVHECVLATLALESDPVDPRL